METIIENKFAPVDVDAKDGLGAFALYLNRKEAEMAVNALERNGFSHSDISMLAPQKSGHHDFVYHQPPSLLQGALLGALVGLVLLGSMGFLFGSREVTMNAPGLGPESTLMTTLVFSMMGVILGAACGVLVGIGSHNA